ncbi:MAG: EamA family transporter [Saprospiraceae bacterium]|nr:EamA family transporter [Saprospiraceae bacterium]
MKSPDQHRGILYMLIASFCFAFTGACARYLRDDINPIELVLFRNLIGIGFIFFLCGKDRPFNRVVNLHC